jgi:hydroxymethylpyrimidine/phosphomethylpyrimidine kinase
MIATSGDRLLRPEAEIAIRTRLLPLAALVTPNLDEASLLTGREVRTIGQMEDAGRACSRRASGRPWSRAATAPATT